MTFDAIALEARIFLLLVFLLSGVAKLRDLEGARKTIKAFGSPQRWVAPLAYLLPFLEITIASLLLFPGLALLGGWMSVALLLLFNLLIGRVIQRGEQIDCHCFGQAHSAPARWNAIARNFGLLILATLPIVRSSTALSVSAVASLTSDAWIGLAVFGLFLLQGVAISFLLDEREKSLSRLAHVESSMFRGLPVGAPAPAFELPDAKGNPTSLQHLLRRRKDLLLFFFDPDCGPCSALLPTAVEWHHKYKDAFVMVFIGRDHEKLGKLKQEEGLVFLATPTMDLSRYIYKTRGFPSAVHITKRGHIGSLYGSTPADMDQLVEQLVGRSGA
jgi:uncharacterized membrane protein YphA (DoxX/SURF4 family)/thiol-disulfide isomerase/thioredoxin